MRVLLTCRPLVGHYRPMLPLARALRGAGHEVAFATGEPIASQAEADGFQSFRAGLDVAAVEPLAQPIRSAAASLPAERLRSFMFTELFIGVELEPRARDLSALVERWRPALLVHEVAEFAAPLVATLAGIPYAEHAFGPALQPSVLAAAGTASASHWASRGLEPQPLAGFYRYLYLDVCPPSLQLEQGVPERVQALRSVELAAPSEPLPWLAALGDLPKLYVTMGTLYNRNLDVFRTLIEGLREQAAQIVVTIGTNNDPAALGPQPPNVHVHRFVPQESLLPHCTAAVTHGGAGSTLGALAFGLPLLVVPRGADQFYNAERVVAAGAGLQLTPDRLSASAVQSAVGRLLQEPTFRAAAGRVQGELAALPDAARAVEALERLVARESGPRATLPG